MVLVTATMSKPREGIDFFPLTIDFEERLYARGRIPGGFPRREGRPTTDSVLTMRLTDRPLRPLFPKDFRNEIQVITTPLSADLETPLDIMSIIGASTALSISDIPFNGPIGVTRIGYVDGEYVINPTYQQSDESTLDLVVAGSRDGVLMMEAGASEVSDEMVLEAIKLAQETNLQIIELQDEIIEAGAKPKAEYVSHGYPKELDSLVDEAVEGKLADAMSPEGGKAEMGARLDDLKNSVVTEIGEEYEKKDISEAFETFVEKEFRRRIIEFGERPDGRSLKEIRPLLSETGISPRAHGTGLFQRGETQVLAFTTLGPVGDKQKIDNLTPVEFKRFMLHYNFPPFSTGETGRMFTGRREIGHGALAERAIASVLPSEEDFPYVIRLVAECLSSNGSTSMASTCAGILSLMDAGVPIKKPVAGISVGLVTDDNGRFVTLTDIQGMEDHFGDMDFKVAGTADGITAIQLDIKVQNIGFEVIEQTLAQAKEARLEVLAKMAEAIDAPRAEVSQYDPANDFRQDTGLQDRRRHRSGRQDHSRHHRGDGRTGRRPGRRHGIRIVRGRRCRQAGRRDDREPDQRGQDRRHLHRQGRPYYGIWGVCPDTPGSGWYGPHQRALRPPRRVGRGRDRDGPRAYGAGHRHRPAGEDLLVPSLPPLGRGHGDGCGKETGIGRQRQTRRGRARWPSGPRRRKTPSAGWPTARVWRRQASTPG